MSKKGEAKPLSDLAEAFLSSLRSLGYAASTLAISRSWLSHFEAHCSVPLSKLRPKDIGLYHQRLQWEPGPGGRLYSENSVNQAVGVLRAYCRWCVEQGELSTCPAAHLVTRRPPPPTKVFLTPHQIRAVLEQPDPSHPRGLRNRALLALHLEHQASPGALARLSLGDFQPDTGALLLPGRLRRIVSLTSGAQTDLERYLRLNRAGLAQPGEEAVFVTRAGHRMGRQNAAQLLKRYLKKAGVPRPSYIL